MLLSTSPVTVATLTSEWDAAETDGGMDLGPFFEIVTSPSLDGAQAIKAHLVGGQDHFAATICAQVVSKHWCCAYGASSDTDNTGGNT